jgi:hypothetical protein
MDKYLCQNTIGHLLESSIIGLAGHNTSYCGFL